MCIIRDSAVMQHVRARAMIINDIGWGYREKRSDDAVEGGVGVRGWGGAVEEQDEGGEGVENDAVERRL